jgi:type IV pilus assembly protein PilO
MEKKGLAKSIEPFLEKVENLSRVQRILISSFFFILILAVFFYFFYWPKFKQMGSLTTQIADLEKKLAKAKRNAADLKKYQDQMKAAQTEFNLAMKKLPEKEEIPSLLTSISDAGQAVGLDFLLFQPKNEKKKEFYAELPVAMSLRGDYHNLAIFFDQVARLNRIVNVENITIARAKDGELTAKCTAVTYKFIDEPPTKKSASSKKKRRRRTKKKK